MIKAYDFYNINGLPLKGTIRKDGTVNFPGLHGEQLKSFYSQTKTKGKVNSEKHS